MLHELRRIRGEIWRRSDGNIVLHEWREAITHLGFKSDVEVVETILEDETVFTWHELLGQYIALIFHSERFPALVVAIEERMPTSLWKEITEAAARDPGKAKQHIEALSPIKSEAAAKAAASLIAGVAWSNPIWAKGLTLSLLNGSKDDVVAALRTTQLCVSERCPGHGRLADAALGMDVPQDDGLAQPYLQSLYTMHDLAAEAVEGRMLEAMRTGSGHMRGLVMLFASLLSNFSTSRRVQIVEMALANNQQGPYDDLGQLLVKIYADDRAYPLKVIRSIAEKDFLVTEMGQNIQYVLLEVGKVDRVTAFRTIDSWFDDDPSDLLLLQIPDILLWVFDRWPKELVGLIGRWSEEEAPRFRARTEVLRELLCRRVDDEGDAVVIMCAEQIALMADLSPTEYDRVVEGERAIGYWSLRVLKAVTSPWGEIDYDRVFRNLDSRPNIKRFLDPQWLGQMRRKGSNDVIVLHMLDCEDDDFLAYWDDVFEHLDPRASGIGKLRHDLRHYYRIQDTLSEAEVISRIGRRFPVEVKISILGLEKEPDLRARLTEQSPILEVYTPEEDRKLLYAGGGGLDGNLTRNKIIDKFRDQYKPGASLIKDPVVFVLHAEGMTLREYDMMNALFGTLGMTLLFDRSSSEVVEQRVGRGDDAIHQMEESAGLISGFLVYRRDSRKPVEEALCVRYFPNPVAWRPLSERSVMELCSALSRDWSVFQA